MTKKQTTKQKEATVDKTEREEATVDKTDENASKVKPAEEVTEPVDEKIDEPVDEQKIKYGFPNAQQCPRCKTYDTVAYSTVRNKQYRKCNRAICRWRYCVTGVKKK